MKRLTLDEFQTACRAQQAKSREDIVMKCPLCSTLQTGADLVAAGAGATFDDVEKYLGYSCVGRFTNAGEWRGKDDAPGRGCNWTLGGLFQLHKLEVKTPDGKMHPTFEPATLEEAQAYRAAKVPA